VNRLAKQLRVGLSTYRFLLNIQVLPTFMPLIKQDGDKKLTPLMNEVVMVLKNILDYNNDVSCYCNKQREAHNNKPYFIQTA